MSFEDRLRRHFRDAAGRLPEPEDRLAEVTLAARKRRLTRRGIAVAAAAAVVLAVPVVLGALGRRTIELQPAAPPETEQEAPPPATSGPSPTPGPGTSPTPSSSPTPGTDGKPAPDVPTPTPGVDGPLAPQELRAGVLAFGPADHDDLRRFDREGDEVLYPGPVEEAYPDGRGGVLLQPAAEGTVLWLPAGEAGEPVTLARTDQALLLRGVLPDGRALYSVRPPDDEVVEGDREEFYAVALEEGAQPEHVGGRMAYESWLGGPVAAAGGELVHASCHLHCALWPGLADAPPGAEPLYQGLAIEGLTATPDGRVLAFVEFDLAQPDLAPPTLVLLDGDSFEVLARHELPDDPDLRPGNPQVSLSADGQRVLVALGTAALPRMPPPVPEVPYLVSGALTEAPTIRRVEARGMLRWLDPVEAAGQGGPVSARERETADALLAFARDPSGAALGELPLAPEVVLGLGPEGFGSFTPAQLEEPGAWELEPEEGHWRAYVGPFSALDVLQRSDEVVVTGGPHPHCASPPEPPPPGLEEARRVSIQPLDADSCLDWFTVDLFLGEAGEVVAVTMDLYEP